MLPLQKKYMCTAKATIFLDNHCICEGINQCISDDDPTAHAVLVALRKARLILKRHSLSQCSLYLTDYPCTMCVSAIRQSHIDNIFVNNNKIDIKKLYFNQIR